MNTREIEQCLKDTTALKNGHFVLTSGLHSDQYIEKFRLLERPRLVERMCLEMSKAYKDYDVGVIIGPATGGIILSHTLATILSSRAIFTERRSLDGRYEMTFRRGFSVFNNENVVIVEDIITTGKSVQEVIDLTQQSFPTANILGVSAIVDRSNGQASFGKVPLKALLSLPINTWSMNDCPQCNAKPNEKPEQPGSTNKT